MPHFQTDPFDDSLLRLILEVCMGVCKMYPSAVIAEKGSHQYPGTAARRWGQSRWAGRLRWAFLAWGLLYCCNIQTVGCVYPPFTAVI